MDREVELSTSRRGRASVPHRTRATVRLEDREALRGDRNDVSLGTRDRASVLVDDEVVSREAPLDRGLPFRKWLDGLCVPGLGQGGQGLARAVGTVGEDLEAGCLAFQEGHARRA